MEAPGRPHTPQPLAVAPPCSPYDEVVHQALGHIKRVQAQFEHKQRPRDRADPVPIGERLGGTGHNPRVWTQIDIPHTYIKTYMSFMSRFKAFKTERTWHSCRVSGPPEHADCGLVLKTY